MAELKRASCTKCGYRSKIITVGATRQQPHNGWPALDKSSNEVVEVDLLARLSSQIHCLYYYNREASRRSAHADRNSFHPFEHGYKHRCPRCGKFHLQFKLVALVD